MILNAVHFILKNLICIPKINLFPDLASNIKLNLLKPSRMSNLNACLFANQ